MKINGVDIPLPTAEEIHGRRAFSEAYERILQKIVDDPNRGAKLFLNFVHWEMPEICECEECYEQRRVIREIERDLQIR